MEDLTLKERFIPEPRKQAEYLMDWAKGEKEPFWYPDGDHVGLNYFDEVMLYVTGWLLKHLWASAKCQFAMIETILH